MAAALWLVEGVEGVRSALVETTTFPAGALVRTRAPRRRPGSRNIDVLQFGRTLRIARVDLHHDVILVVGLINDRHLPLSEGVIKRAVDLRRAEPQPIGGVAIDHDIRLQRLQLLVRTYVAKDVAVLQGVDELWRPGIQFGAGASKVY